MAKDAKIRARAKALYEKGESLRDIAAELHTAFTSVKNWAKKEGWVKGKAAPKLAQLEEEALEREAGRKGVTKARILAKVDNLLDAQHALIETPFGYTRIPLPKGCVVDASGATTVNGKPALVVDDRATQTDMVKVGADILGMKRVQVDPSDEFRAFFGSLKGGAK